MAQIHIARGETRLGIFAEEEVQEGLRSGRFAATDLAWREGMPSWLPLAQMNFDTGHAPTLPSGIARPNAKPDTPGIGAAASTGLPWDHRQELGLLPAFIETLKLVLLNPSTAFSGMKTEGGLSEPLTYGVIGASVGFIVNFLFSLLMSSFGFMGNRNALAGVLGAGIGAVALIVFIPVLIALGLFIGFLCHRHVCTAKKRMGQ